MTEIKNIKIIHSKDEAIKRIQAAYGGVVKNLIKEILNDERLVEECMSEVWYRLSVHLSKFEDLGSHKTRAYICKTAKTAAIDIYRREKHEIPIGSGDDVRRFAEDEYNLVCDDIEKLHLSEEIKEVLSTRSPLDRKIFIRHRGYKFTYKEIGEELGMSRDAVRKRGERAEKMLQNAKREE